MIKIELYNASNGIVKKIINTNSVEECSENYKLYELSDEEPIDNFFSIISLFYDINADLALEVGSDYDEAQLKFNVDWGDKYIPSVEEIDEKIKDLKSQIKTLKEIRSDISNNGHNV
jgi:hypothetical protein